jgi:hypothetical protein
MDESKDWYTSIDTLIGNDERTFLCLTYFIMAVQQLLTLSFTTLLFLNHNKLSLQPMELKVTLALFSLTFAVIMTKFCQHKTKEVCCGSFSFVVFTSLFFVGFASLLSSC